MCDHIQYMKEHLKEFNMMHCQVTNTKTCSTIWLHIHRICLTKKPKFNQMRFLALEAVFARKGLKHGLKIQG